MFHQPRTRHGAVLILVAGIAALLISISLAFLTRMRSDAEETVVTMRETQARLMLSAACNYILEASRLGWETTPPGEQTPPVATRPDAPPSPHQEAFGWIDVRDGRIGPRLSQGEDVLPVSPDRPQGDSARFPLFTGFRFPMYVRERPPYAIRLDAVYNPIAASGPDEGLPWLINPDPQPQASNRWNGGNHTVNPTVNDWYDYKNGDPRPRIRTMNRAWFRLWRDGPATFVVTCGAGGTLGYRLKDWNVNDPVTGLPMVDHALFGNDYETFRDLDAHEIRFWYRVEWSAAVLALDYHNLDHELGIDRDHYMSWPPNASHTWRHSRRTQMHAKNMVGTISWVQRLVTEPTNW